MKRVELNTRTIKDIWGYLIIFAWTKKITIELHSFINAKWLGIITDTKNDDDFSNEETLQHKEPEQSMLWCADKFFEVAK